MTGCLALAAVSEPLRHVLGGLVPKAVTITVAGTAGVIAYAAALRLVSPATWRDLKMLAGRILPRLDRGRGAVPAPAATPSGS